VSDYRIPDGWDDVKISATGLLALFLGGSHDSFTGLLLVLFQKADPDNLARLRLAFPRVALAWETWGSMSPVPTFRELADALTAAAPDN
jgi:hypothetical protein